MADASQGGHADEQDASMDTILASIRRIILEDEAGAAPPEIAPVHDEEADDDLLVLQPSMIVDPEGPKGIAMVEPAGLSHSGTQSAADLAAALFDDPLPSPAPISVPAPAPAPVAAQFRPDPAPPPPPPQSAIRPPVEPVPHEPVVDQPLLAPAASLAAAQALASLQDAMRPEPALSASPRLLRSGGPTIEDMVRDELRVQLKDWLDVNLPSLVERLVAQEIGRLVGRG